MGPTATATVGWLARARPIAASPSTQPYTISSLAFGRDNNGHDNGGGPYDNDYAGMYVLQYTTVLGPQRRHSRLVLDLFRIVRGGYRRQHLGQRQRHVPAALVPVQPYRRSHRRADPRRYGQHRISTSTNWRFTASRPLDGRQPRPPGATRPTGTASPATVPRLTFTGSAGLAAPTTSPVSPPSRVTFGNSAGAFTLGGNSLSLAGNVTTAVRPRRRST